jgi:hypothetical protein
MWEEIEREFAAIPKRKYDANPIKNRKIQEKILEENIRFFTAAILKAHGSHTGALESYNGPTSPFNKLNDWGIYFNEFIPL